MRRHRPWQRGPQPQMSQTPINPVRASFHTNSPHSQQLSPLHPTYPRPIVEHDENISYSAVETLPVPTIVPFLPTTHTSLCSSIQSSDAKPSSSCIPTSEPPRTFCGPSVSPSRTSSCSASPDPLFSTPSPTADEQWQWHVHLRSLG